jgi:hypothetical protein
VDSQIFHDLKNEQLDIVERLAPSEAKGGTDDSIKAGDVEAPTTFGSFAPRTKRR